MSDVRLADGFYPKIGDRLLCVKTPAGSSNPNMKVGMSGLVIKTDKRKASVNHKYTELNMIVFGRDNNTPTGETYMLWQEDYDCYVKMGNFLPTSMHLKTYNSKSTHAKTYEVTLARNGSVYCNCWQWKKNKTCSHLEYYLREYEEKVIQKDEVVVINKAILEAVRMITG